MTCTLIHSFPLSKEHAILFRCLLKQKAERLPTALESTARTKIFLSAEMAVVHGVLIKAHSAKKKERESKNPKAIDSNLFLPKLFMGIGFLLVRVTLNISEDQPRYVP